MDMAYFRTCQASRNYVVYLLRKLNISVDDARQKLVVPMEDAKTVVEQLHWMTQDLDNSRHVDGRLESFFELWEHMAHNPKNYVFDDKIVPRHSGLLLFIGNDYITEARRRLRKYDLGITEVDGGYIGTTILVLELADKKKRFAMAQRLLAEFDPEVRECLEGRKTTFHVFGESVAQLLMGKVSPEQLDFSVEKNAVKKYANVRMPWRRCMDDFLKELNSSTNERVLFDSFRRWLADAGRSLEKTTVKETTAKESLRAQHSRLMAEVMRNVRRAVPERRGTSQFLAEMLVDRKQNRFPWVNTDAMLIYVGDDRFSLSCRKEAILELVKVKKQMHWWNSTNQRLFINSFGRFFADDRACKTWLKNYSARQRKKAKVTKVL